MIYLITHTEKKKMQSIEKSIGDICTERDVNKYLEELYMIIQNHYERIKKACNRDIEDIMLSYTNEASTPILKISEFLNMQTLKEDNIALLDKYEELNNHMFKIKTTILKTHECINDMKEELFKIQNDIVNGLMNYGEIEKMEKTEEDNKRQMREEIELLHRMGKNRMFFHQQWFINDTVIEMEAMMEKIQSFYFTWNKITKGETTSHNSMY